MLWWLILWRRKHRLGGSFLHNPTRIEEANPVGDLAGKSHLVGDNDHGKAMLMRESRMTARTSPTNSGSGALVTSSKSMIFGRIARALAIATRCCCPPDNSAG